MVLKDMCITCTQEQLFLRLEHIRQVLDELHTYVQILGIVYRDFFGHMLHMLEIRSYNITVVGNSGRGDQLLYEDVGRIAKDKFNRLMIGQLWKRYQGKSISVR